MQTNKRKNRKHFHIECAQKRRDYPLSFQQQRLWYLSRLIPGSPLWNRLSCKRLQGEIHVGFLKKALSRLADRHAILRTKVIIVNGKPRQSLSQSTADIFQYVDLSSHDQSLCRSKAAALLHKESKFPIYLNEGPLFRGILIKLSEADHMLLLKLHHIISDATTFQILWRDLKTLYNPDTNKKETDTLPPLRLQYHDYVLWQQEMFADPLTKEQENYWLGQFAGEIPVLDLPTDFSPPAQLSFRGDCVKAVLNKELAKSLRSLSLRKRVLLFSTLLTVYFILLQKYCRQDDVIIGTAFNGRHYSGDLNDIAGFFVNTVAVRMNIAGNPFFDKLLEQIHEKVNEAYAMQDYPFERLIRKINPDRHKRRNPLFQALFNMVNHYKETASFTGTTGESWLEPETHSSQVDILLDVNNNPEDMEIRFEYNTDLFKEETITRMINHYINLLRGVVNEPGTSLSKLEMLDNRERKQLLAEWNDSRSEYPRDKCIHKLFTGQARHNPDRVSLLYEDEHLTYVELNDRANQLAHYLKSLGVGPEVPVCICVERSLEMMVGVLGILKAGGAYAPLNPGDPVKRKVFMLRDTNASVLLTQQSLSWTENFSQCEARIVYMDREWENIAAGKVNDMEINISPGNLAYVMYTSGSTGFPKGVCAVHRAVVRLVKYTNFAEFGVNDILLAFAPLSFDASTLEIWGSLLNGSRLVIFPAIKPSLEELGKFILKQTVTLLWLTAGLFHQMVENRLEDLKYVRRLLAGGDVLSPHYVRKVVVRFPGCRLINGYGPTENTTFTACCDLSSINKFESSVPIGRPVANTRVYILDLHMQPTPIGIKGELYTGGDGLGRGYLGRPELTAERFIPNPYGDTPGESLYKTGDIARYLADGNIEFLGRIDQQVKIRGFRIELGEIESTLTRHPGIKESAVLVQKNGSKTEQLTAYVVFKNKREPGRSELRGYLQERLPAYMVPSVFVELESLPLTPNGKIDRRVLPAPGNDRAGLEYPPAAPRTPTEKILVETWSQVLAVEQVGIFDDFFDLGGHSLLAMQLVLRISDAVGINIPMNKILEIPYIAGLADYIEINAGSKTYMADAPGAIPNNNREEGRI